MGSNLQPKRENVEKKEKWTDLEKIVLRGEIN